LPPWVRVTGRWLLGLALYDLTFALLASGLLHGCEAGPDGAVEVPLATLAAEPRNFEGRRVVVRGTVRGIEEPLHFWIEDENFNRVQLIPDEAAVPYRDVPVRAVGRFQRGDRGGRELLVEEIGPH
jgi:hypothetical protein